MLLFEGHRHESKIYMEVLNTKTMGEEFILGINEEEYKKSAGMRTGLVEAEMGMPAWKTPGVSIEFPYTITEEDWPDEKRSASLYASLKKFALQPILDAVAVPLTSDDKGILKFDHMACVGKKFLLNFVMVKDSRTAEEGGTGGTYPKATSAHKLGTQLKDLGI